MPRIRFAPLSLALTLAMATAMTTAAQDDPNNVHDNGRASVDRALGDLQQDRGGVDPRQLSAWSNFCDAHPGKGSCEVVLKRMGHRAVVGVLLAPDAAGGVRIAGVTPDGAAAAAGLKAGDRLLRIGGKPIAGASPEARVDAARTLLQGIDEKTAVKLAYARDGREAEVSVTPKVDQRLMVFTGDGGMLRPGGNVVVRQLEGVPGADGRRIEIETLGPGPAAMGPGVAMPGAAMPIGGDAGMAELTGVVPGADGGVEQRVIRIECRRGDRDCVRQRPIGAFSAQLPAGELRLLDAFRWNGLNLASVDAKLGRYFGTDQGVLVLSAGPALDSLEPGDVIQRVDGKRVGTPREVMDALRGKPADSRVPVEYLRDRKAASTKIKVPQTMPIGTMPLASIPPMTPVMPMAGMPVAGLPVPGAPVGAMPMPVQGAPMPGMPAGLAPVAGVPVPGTPIGEMPMPLPEAPLPPPPPARVD
jgi:membrane-associated protease RseP (regulator of RpoE activity)